MAEEIRRTESGEVCCSAWNIRQDQWCPHPAKEDGLCKFHLDARHLNASLDKMKEETGVRPGSGETNMDLDEVREKVLELYASGITIREALEACGANKWDLTNWRKVAWFRSVYERIQAAKVEGLEELAHEMASRGVRKQVLNKDGTIVNLFDEDPKHVQYMLQVLNPLKYKLADKVIHDGNVGDGLTQEQRLAVAEARAIGDAIRARASFRTGTDNPDSSE